MGRIGLGGAMILAAVVVAAPAPVAADPPFPTSTLIGPLFGIAWGKDTPLHPSIGVEGGVGLNILLYGNAGVTWRGDELLSYVELDGWYVVGGTLGIGHGTRTGWQGVYGVWEVLPPKVIDERSCDEATQIVFSVGYRYTGLHEVYLASKYGTAPVICFD